MKLTRRRRHARDVARALGAGATPGWAVRALTRATAPDWLFVALERARGEAGAGERPAVVVSVVSQGVRLRRLVLLSFEDFAALAGVAPGDEGAGEGAGGGDAR